MNPDESCGAESSSIAGSESLSGDTDKISEVEVELKSTGTPSALSVLDSASPEEKKDIHRKNVITELVSTEERYIQDLHLVVEVISFLSMG